MTLDSMIKNYDATMRLFNENSHKPKKEKTVAKDSAFSSLDENKFKRLLEHEMSRMNSPTTSVIDYTA